MAASLILLAALTLPAPPPPALVVRGAALETCFCRFVEGRTLHACLGESSFGAGTPAGPRLRAVRRAGLDGIAARLGAREGVALHRPRRGCAFTR